MAFHFCHKNIFCHGYSKVSSSKHFLTKKRLDAPFLSLNNQFVYIMYVHLLIIGIDVQLVGMCSVIDS